LGIKELGSRKRLECFLLFIFEKLPLVLYLFRASEASERDLLTRTLVLINALRFVLGGCLPKPVGGARCTKFVHDTRADDLRFGGIYDSILLVVEPTGFNLKQRKRNGKERNKVRGHG